MVCLLQILYQLLLKIFFGEYVRVSSSLAPYQHFEPELDPKYLLILSVVKRGGCGCGGV